MSTQPKTTKKKPIRVTIDPGQSPEGWEDEKRGDDTINSDDLAMEEAVRGLAEGERYLKLYRVNEQGGRPRFLAHLIPEEFNEGYVAERFGGGRYFARWKMTDGTWKRYPFEIEGEPLPVQRIKPVAEEEEEEAQFIPPPQQTMGGGGENFSLRDMLLFMQQAEDRSFRQLQMMLQLMRPAPPPQAPTEQVFSLIEKLAPMLQGAGGEGGNPWLIGLNQLKEPLTKLVDSVYLAMAAKGVPAQPAPAGPPAAPTIPSAPKAEPMKDTPPDMLAYIRQVLPLLVTAAAKNADPQTYADLLLDQLPPLSYAPLKEWLLKPGCLDQLAHIEPGIRFQAEWWESLRAAIVEALTEGADNELGTVQPNEAPRPSASAATASGSAFDASERAGD